MLNCRNAYTVNFYVALLKVQVSLQLGITSNNEVSVYIMHSHLYWLLYPHTAKADTLSGELISHNMYECFMNTKYLCPCLQKICYKFEP